MKRLLRFFFIFSIEVFFLGSAVAQNPLLTNDSVEVLLKLHPQRDTVHVGLLNQLAFGNYYSNPLKSLQCSFDARKISDSLNYTKGEAESLRQIGLAYWAQSDMSTAITYYFAGLRIATDHHHAQEAADLTGNIGTAYNGMGQYREALGYLHQARKMQQALKNEWREASIANNIGDSYLALGLPDSARWAYQLALQKSKEQHYRLGESTNIRNLGNVLEFEKKFAEALEHYRQCLAISEEIADARGVILSNKSMASVYLKTNQPNLAYRHAEAALARALKGKLKAYIRDSYELLATISERQGDRLKAFDFYKKHILYKDSIQNIKVISEVNAQRFRYETESKLNEIAMLKKESELQAAEVKLRNNQLFYLIVVLVVLFGALAFAIWNHRAVEKRNKMLNEKNQEIEAQRFELAHQRDELTALNGELVLRQNELSEKNTEIESMNQKIMETNNNLERIVQERTDQLQKQNEQLAQYAHFNAHQLRAPVASILGLSSLLQKPGTEQEKEELAAHLRRATEKLDSIIREMSNTLEE